MKRDPRAAGLAPACILLLLGACSASARPVAVRHDTVPPASSPPAAPSMPATPPAALVSRAAAGPDPCAALGRIVDSEPEGFLVLRGRSEGEGRWGGTVVPAGFADCWIEDLAVAGPHYLCRAERFAIAPETLAADHLALLAAHDVCLARPTWFPLSWRRVPDIAMPNGSRRAAWRAAAVGPVVTLALEPHPDRPLWWNRLVVGPSG